MYSYMTIFSVSVRVLKIFSTRFDLLVPSKPIRFRSICYLFNRNATINLSGFIRCRPFNNIPTNREVIKICPYNCIIQRQYDCMYCITDRSMTAMVTYASLYSSKFKRTAVFARLIENHSDKSNSGTRCIL